jgi:hypothetical protein
MGVEEIVIDIDGSSERNLSISALKCLDMILAKQNRHLFSDIESSISLIVFASDVNSLNIYKDRFKKAKATLETTLITPDESSVLDLLFSLAKKIVIAKKKLLSLVPSMDPSDAKCEQNKIDELFLNS